MKNEPVLPRLVQSSTAPWIFLLVVIIVSAVSLSRGLGGDFLIDDFRHLSHLTEFRESESKLAWLEYLQDVPTGTSRPVSVLSFLPQAESWPNAAEDFLAVNILLHLVNGALVFLLLLSTLGRERRWLAALVAAFWLLNPIHLSTVFYPIQRMVLLASLFTLAGLLLYLVGRRLELRRQLPGRLLMLAGIAGFGGLAALSKETGVLILLYALLVDWLMRERGVLPVSNFGRLLLWLPLGLLLLVLLTSSQLLAGYQIRDFTLPERLLTQGRVLGHYLVQILLPGIHDYIPFHDGYPVSRSLFTPWTTFFSWAFLVGTTVFAYLRRHSAPFTLFAFGWFWFLAGHLLESTVLPLELVFEHRNYLPALGILLGVTALIAELIRRIRAQSRRQQVAALSAFVALAALTVFISNVSALWGHPYKRAIVWAERHPESQRANIEVAYQHLRFYQTEKGIETLRHFSERSSEPLPYQMVLFQLLCIDKPDHALPGEREKLLHAVIEEAASAPFDWVPMNTLELMGKAISSGRTSECSRATIARLYLALAENPAYTTRRVALTSAAMQQYQLLGEQQKADAIAAELAAQNDLRRIWETLARHLHASGRTEEAIAVIDRAKDSVRWTNPAGTVFLLYEAEQLRKQLANENTNNRQQDLEQR